MVCLCLPGVTFIPSSPLAEEQRGSLTCSVGGVDQLRVCIWGECLGQRLSHSHLYQCLGVSPNSARPQLPDDAQVTAQVMGFLRLPWETWFEVLAPSSGP